jgi:hypothetical protein
MRLLGLLLVLALVGFLVYRFVLTSADQRSCQRLADLCGDKAAAVDSCMHHIGGLGKTSRESVDKFHSCISGASSCGEAAGCVVGAGFSAAGKTVNDFIKGLGKAFDKK